MADFHKKHPWISSISIGVAVGLILIVIRYLKEIWAVLTYPVPFTILGLVVVVGLLFLFVVLYVRERRKHRSHWRPQTDLVSNDGILWQYSDEPMTDGRGLEIEKAICPNLECKNELDMPEWSSSEAPVFGVQATCKKCGFSKRYPLFRLDGLELLAKREIERLHLLKETPWQKVKGWISSGGKSK